MPSTLEAQSRRIAYFLKQGMMEKDRTAEENWNYLSLLVIIGRHTPIQELASARTVYEKYCASNRNSSM
jgi:hypothetical protein